jgi:hypothetical protein
VVVAEMIFRWFVLLCIKQHDDAPVSHMKRLMDDMAKRAKDLEVSLRSAGKK